MTSESERVAAVRRYELLDTPAEAPFDRITRLAKLIFDVPIVYLSLIDGQRQWMKSVRGMKEVELRREHSLCNHTIRQTFPMVIPDLRADSRFAANPLVTGAPYLRFYAGAPLRTADGHSIGTLCCLDTKVRSITGQNAEILNDLARIVVDEMDLRLLATVDSLTGAMTRRAFSDALNRSLALAKRHDQELGCVMIDVDNFKLVNDRYGHPVGDLVLQRLVAICKTTLRASDFVGRLGGEEFAVVLPLTSASAAMTAAERLRKGIATEPTFVPFMAPRITASFGVAAYDADVMDPSQLLKRADLALYAAKANGRNQCVCFTESLAAQAA
ncbi:MAG: sensor domain-containing diguanylate cyclase [Methylobacteriaceae bacterium]|nr:sensor domain-containing diguanylate cyclase [Methylobacteriaceae bacterium]